MSPSAPHRRLKKIGIIFYNHFLFNEHIASICKSCFYHLRNISHLGKYLSSTATELLDHASVSSKLDHCTEFFSLWLTELPNKTVTAHPECCCSFYQSFKKTWRPGLQVICFSWKDKCPTKTPCWSDKTKFWSDIRKKRLNFISGKSKDILR